jgi:CBS domain-containing protein
VKLFFYTLSYGSFEENEKHKMNVTSRMTSKPVIIHPDDTLAIADERMRAGDFRRMPVEEEGRLVGIVSEYDLEPYRGSLGSLRVRDVMTRDVITIPWLATEEHAIHLLRQHKIGALPVVDHGRVVGIITARDLGVVEPQPLPEWDPRTRRERSVQFIKPASG